MTDRTSKRTLLAALAMGLYFGIVLTKGELISWYRIQEMFRFQSFHMYGTLFSGIAVAWLGVRVVNWTRRDGGADPSGQDAAGALRPKPADPTSTRYWIGGGIFGLGWGIMGACPGPIYALFGAGVTVAVIPFLAALAGVWAYGALAPRLPH